MTRRRSVWFRVACVFTFTVLLCSRADAVIPVVVGPLQALLPLLPGILAAMGGMVLAMFKPSTAKKILSFLWHQKLFSALLILVIGGVVYASNNNWWIRGTVTEAVGGNDWPMGHGGEARRGVVIPPDDSPEAAQYGEPNTSDLVWEYVTEKIFYATPTVVGNRIFITFADKGYFADRGAVLCIDAGTGAEVWRYNEDGYRATFSSPSVYGEYVVCGEGLHTTTDARIVCINRNTGKGVWSLRTRSHVESSPCIYKDRVYIGAGDDGYYCINLKPGPGGKPEVVWHTDPSKKEYESFKDCETSPVVYKGVLYVGLGIGGEALVALDPDTGKELWRVKTPCPVFSAPSAANDKVYFAMGHGDLVYTAEQVKANLVLKLTQQGRSRSEIEAATKHIKPGGEVWCLDLKKGTGEQCVVRDKNWPVRVGQTILGAVAIAAERNRIYFGSRDGKLYCCDAETGEIKAARNLHAPIVTSPAVGKEYAYVVSGDGRLHCLSIQDDALEPLWDVPLGGPGLYVSSPTMARGHIYVGTAADGLRCIGRVGKRPPAVWAQGARGGRVERSSVPPRSQLDWRYPREEGPKIEVTSPLLCLGDMPARAPAAGEARVETESPIFVPCIMDGKPSLLKLRPNTEGKGGQETRKLSDEERLAWTIPFGRPIRVAPVGVGTTIYVVDGEPGDEGRALRSIDAVTGRVNWQMAVAADAPGGLSLDAGHLILWTRPDTLTCYPTLTPEPPAPLWELSPGAGSVAPEISDGILFVATNKELNAYDLPTGTPLWSAPALLPARPNCPPLRVEEFVVVATDAGLRGYSITSGALEWKADVGAVRVSPAADASSIAAVTAKEEVVVFRLSDIRVGARAKRANVRHLRECTELADTICARLAPLLQSAGFNFESMEEFGSVQKRREMLSNALKNAPALLAHVSNTLDNVPPAFVGKEADPTVPPVCGSGRIVYSGKADLMVIRELTDDRAYQWGRSGWLGRVITPIVFQDSKAYFVTDKRGLICFRPSTQ